MKRESELAKELGVNRVVLSDYRKGPMPGKCWLRFKNAIWITKGGEKWLHDRLAEEVGHEMVEFESEPPGPREMEVVSRPRNTRMLICRLGDEEVRVKCRDNANFLKGMKLTARPPALDSKMWVLEGRCPRWRGRW